MAKRKNPVYKTGRKNPNAYKDIRKIRDAIALGAIAFLLVCFGFITILEKFDIVSWGELLNKTGILDTVSEVDSDFAVYYLDAGQSDCTIVTSGDEVMMIDSGTYNQLDTIVAALKSLNINTIDYLVITHQHDDHMGSASKIIENYNVKNIIMPRLTEINMVTSYNYEELLNTISKNKVTVIAAEPKRNFKIGEATVEFFAPLQQYESLNNMSAVLKISYGETSFLFQGDAEKEVESALLKKGYDLSADIIKVGHHGSKTSSTSKYIKAVSPKAAIISCGAGNRYGHPSNETLATLENFNVDTYITMNSGDITAISDGKTITITTENSDEVNIYE